METDEEDITVLPVTSKMSGAIERHNQKVRRRNVTDTVNLSQDHKNDLNFTAERIPLVLLPDSTEAWYDGIIPRIPDTADLTSSGKQNGVLGQDSDTFMDNSCVGVEELTNLERMKISVIRGTITKPDLSLGDFRLLGSSNEGFVTDGIRRVLWPKILRLSMDEIIPVEGLKTIYTKIPNEVYQQILKDVARSGSHISPTATEKETEHFQDQLTQIICWVLHRHPELNYYQGYNDVAATILLVMGLQEGLYVLESISMEFLERFMEKTMEKVNQELFYIFALLERVHPTLLEHLENVELFPHFALAEYTTWYAHKYAENRKLLHRLYDYFLSCPPLMPLYLSSVIVAHRATEIFNTTPDMGHTHKVLCTLPDNLPFETLLIDAKNLYCQYPPESINKDVKDYDCKRRCKEQEWKAKAEASRQERERQRRLKIVKAAPRIPYRIRSYKTITVVTILALGLYAFLKSTSSLN
ncbi:TBC1 domain family member 20 [Vespa velutina]|uniref:TBC1 domain family member 20 n=1 Tax=Vespa velutina TaxID=202808 RepID=UPI001FB41CC5|nr:TBC1 domain family member 20 [Vespa velutina]XP_047350219.1 TBC1 domain family member 20 [Vespa velutina]XP_047350220.1 TBC1 domain family member 20 [Vespa velutina]